MYNWFSFTAFLVPAKNPLTWFPSFFVTIGFLWLNYPNNALRTNSYVWFLHIWNSHAHQIHRLLGCFLFQPSPECSRQLSSIITVYSILQCCLAVLSVLGVSSCLWASTALDETWNHQPESPLSIFYSLFSWLVPLLAGQPPSSRTSIIFFTRPRPYLNPWFWSTSACKFVAQPMSRMSYARSTPDQRFALAETTSKISCLPLSEIWFKKLHAHQFRNLPSARDVHGPTSLGHNSSVRFRLRHTTWSDSHLSVFVQKKSSFLLISVWVRQNHARSFRRQRKSIFFWMQTPHLAMVDCGKLQAASLSFLSSVTAEDHSAHGRAESWPA